MGFGLYEPAFATIAGPYGREARKGITGVILFAGSPARAAGRPAPCLSDPCWRDTRLAWAALHLRLHCGERD